MAAMLKLTLPMPPSINNYYKSRVITVKGKKIPSIYIDSSVIKFRADVLDIVCKIVDSPLTGRIAISVTFFPKTWRSFDIDNPLKGLLDALTKAAVWNDDSQVDEIIARRGDRPINGGMCVVEIRQL